MVEAVVSDPLDAFDLWVRDDAVDLSWREGASYLLAGEKPSDRLKSEWVAVPIAPRILVSDAEILLTQLRLACAPT